MLICVSPSAGIKYSLYNFMILFTMTKLRTHSFRYIADLLLWPWPLLHPRFVCDGPSSSTFRIRPSSRGRIAQRLRGKSSLAQPKPFKRVVLMFLIGFV